MIWWFQMCCLKYQNQWHCFAWFQIDNIYAVRLTHISPIHLSCFKVSFYDTWFWYHRLEHVSMHTLYKLVKHDLVRGLPPYKYEKDNLCCACVKGKQVCASFKSLKSASTSKCLELLHVDLCGPIYIRSLGGSLYVFVRSDDYFRLTWVVFLKDKTKSHKEF